MEPWLDTTRAQHGGFVVVEGLGCLARWSLSGGQAHDVTQAEAILDGIVTQAIVRIPAKLNTDSGMMNSDSGNPGKLFTLSRNERSHTTRIGVHVEPE